MTCFAMSPRDVSGKADTLNPPLPTELGLLLKERDGPESAARWLMENYSPEVAATDAEKQRIWEIAGQWLMGKGRPSEALGIFRSLYCQLLSAQELTKERFHKGAPLCFMADCYRMMGHLVHAKRCLMLTLCEDAVSGYGCIDPNLTGVYARLVWQDALPHTAVARYAQEIRASWEKDQVRGRFPEWLLGGLDQDWLIEVPTADEARRYAVCAPYVRYLVGCLGDSTGESLERLAGYLLSCMSGCRTVVRARTPSTDYDIVCSMEGSAVDFRAEFGRYFVCECKDWCRPADFTSIAKFCRVLDSIKARFGIMFSNAGITGKGATADAEREQLKVYQDRGIVIVVVDRHDLDAIADGANMIQLLRAKYERVRLDLSPS